MSVLTRARKLVGRAARWLISFVDSTYFFWIVLGIFTVQALWMAWSGAYSMAYDEFFHLAAIQEYAKHLLPIATESVTHPELGAFSRDPSFLYHYLFSFPYRLIIVIWHNFTAQIIALRVLNLGMFLGGMFVFWRTLLRAGFTKRLANSILFAFSLVPTFVFVASQLNYDNMLFLVSAITVYLATDYLMRLKGKKPLSIPRVLLLVGMLLAGSVVKYAFLPIAAAVGGILVIETILAFRRRDISLPMIRVQFASSNKLFSVLSAVFLIFALGVFAQRIGGNLIRYHAPAPDCAQVLSYDDCLQHDAYARNANYTNLKLSEQLSLRDKLTYPIRWYQQMLQESFFVVSPKQTGYQTGTPLPTAYIAGYIIATALVFILITSAFWLLKENAVWRLWFITSVSYLIVLFGVNYKEYLRLGVPVAIHGRYAVPVIILLGALGAVAIRRYMHTYRRLKLRIAVAASVLIVLLILGGGWLPWIIRSTDSWIWPHAVQATKVVRSLLWPFIIK